MIRYTHKSNIATRLAMLVMVLLGVNTLANADNVVSIADFSIAPGEQKEVSLNLDNTDVLFGVEGKITLPAGLAFVANAYGEGVHADGGRGAALKTLNPKTGQYIVRTVGTALSGNTGAVMKFKVIASTELPATSTITLTAKVKPETGNSFAAETLPCTVTNAEGGSDTPDTPTPDEETLTLAFSPASLTINSGDETSIEVQLTNGMALSGVEAVVKASAGLTVKKVAKSDRLTGWGYNEKTGKLYSLGGISGNSGAIFTVTVQANEDFAGNGTLTISDINFTTSSAKNYEVDDIQMEISVLDVSGVGDANVVWSFAGESVNLAPGRSVDVEVSMTNDVNLTGFEAQLMLPDCITAKFTAGERLSGALNYNAASGKLYSFGNISGNEGVLFTMTLTADDTFTSDQTVQLNNINVTTVEAQNFSPASITLTVKAQDEELFNELSTEIADLQQKLDDAKKHIAEEDAIVAGDYTKDLEAIQDAINTLSEKVAGDYEANTLDKEGTEAEVAKIAADIENVVKAADDAQKTLDANYAELQKALTDLQNKYDEAKKHIAEDDAIVADDYAKDLEAIQDAITDLGKKVSDDYAANNLDKEGAEKEIAAIAAELENLVKAADEAQQAVDADYAELQKKLADLQSQYDDAKKHITEDDAAVADKYAEQLEAIQNAITDLGKKVADEYAADALDKEGAEAEIEKIAEQIAALVKDADEALQALDSDYAALKTEIAKLQDKLDTAKEHIAKDDADVADSFADEVNAIQEAITNLDKAVDDAYAADDLNKDAFTPQIEDISKQIDQLQSDADVAQEKFTEDMERQQLMASAETLRKRANDLEATIAMEELGEPFTSEIAAIQGEITDLENHILNDEPLDKDDLNKTAKQINSEMDALEKKMKTEIDMKHFRDQLLAILDQLQEELNKAKSTIETDYADVADDEAIVAKIDEIQQIITKTYQDVWYKWADKTLTPDYKIDEKGIRNKIAELLAMAAEAQGESQIVPGDIDGNGTVDDADLDKIITALLNKDLPEAGTAMFKRYDANVDGKINIIDVLAIKNLFVYGTINPEE